MAATKVLRAGDEPVVAAAVSGALKARGYTIVLARDAMQAFMFAVQQQPDAILLDISMDGLDGWQTAQQIRSLGYNAVPIIVVSANVMENQSARLKSAGCQAFVAKPVLESELMDALQRHLGLEWVNSGVLPIPTPISPEGDTRRLSDDARAELIRLVRLGHVHGLHRVLDRFTADDPTLAATCKKLRGFVSRCELESLLDHLTEDEDACEP